MLQSCKIQIKINNASLNMLKSITESLEPDNINFPKNLTLKTTVNKNQLILNFTNEGDMGKLINTIDEILAHIQLIVKVVNNVRS
ncbi:MAG: KEOPS complex subunit Pcc1 [Thaumarchaeota archaeon]|nr:KEOPS complex subunit Pcc1 [Nitrososphaerota archaeon]MCY3976359.1 KEOPS complex subunit Pcc1 [Nitrososphaerota archaeon]